MAGCENVSKNNIGHLFPLKSFPARVLWYQKGEVSYKDKACHVSKSHLISIIYTYDV